MPEPAGALNAYHCRACAGQIITVNRDEGTTPFTLGCRATPRCPGVMQSAFYAGVRGKPTHEWYRPARPQRRRLDPDTRDHVERGGLLIRRAGEGNQP